MKHLQALFVSALVALSVCTTLKVAAPPPVADVAASALDSTISAFVPTAEAASFHVALGPDGNAHSSNPDGNIGTSCSWNAIPAIAVTNGSSGSVDLSTYRVGCSSAITMVAVGGGSCSFSGGFGFSAPSITYASTTTVSLLCYASAGGVLSLAPVAMSSTGSSSDTTAPPAPSITVAKNAASPTTSIDVTCLAWGDPWVSGQVASGLKDCQIFVDGSGTPAATLSLAAGISPQLTDYVLGTATSTSKSQSGAQWTIGATTGDFYGTTDNGYLIAPATPISGDFSVMACMNAWGATGNAFAEAIVGYRKTMDPASSSAYMVAFPDSTSNGRNMEHRLTAGAGTTQEARIPGSTMPGCLREDRSASTGIATGYDSTDGNNWVQRYAVAVPMTDPVFPKIGIGTTTTAATATFTRVSINNSPAVSTTLTGFTAGSTHTITAKVRDLAGTPNVSSASPGASVTLDAAVTVTEYPLLGRIDVGNPGPPTFCDSTQKAYWKFFDMVAVGSYQSMQGGACTGSNGWGESIASIVSASSAVLGTSTKVIAYGEIDYCCKYRSSGPDAAVYAKFNAQTCWWLYQNGCSGTIVDSFYNESPRGLMINLAPGATADSNGFSPSQWLAHCVLDDLYTARSYGTGCGGTNSAAPQLWGMYVDDGYLRTRVAGDYDRNGTTDPANDFTFGQGQRVGQASFTDTARSLQPNFHVCLNAAEYGQSSFSGSQRAEFLGKFDCVLMEGLMGFDFSQDTWGGWPAVVDAVQNMTSLSKSGAPGLFGQIVTLSGADNVDGVNLTSGDTTSWRPAKYGFVAAQIFGQYFAASANAGYPAGSRHWFDYYCADPNTGTAVAQGSCTSSTQRKWMGAASATYATIPSTGSLGLYYRLFAGKTGHPVVCVLNPKGNGTQTVPQSFFNGLGGTWKAFSGGQDTANDNGATITAGRSLVARSAQCFWHTMLDSILRVPAANDEAYDELRRAA